MDVKEAELLNRELLALLRESAPWAAEQVEETVRQGKTVLKNVPRRLRTEWDVVVDEKKSLGQGKLAMTQDLTETESLEIMLEAVECLLIQPSLIAEEIDWHLQDVKIPGVMFIEPSEQEEGEPEGGAVGIPQESRGRISALLSQIRSDLLNDG